MYCTTLSGTYSELLEQKSLALSFSQNALIYKNTGTSAASVHHAFFLKKIVPLLSGVCAIVWSMVKLNASSTSTFTSLGYAVREFPN
jgi:hypothetical protein